jgi:hypothetical protein
MAAFHLIIYGRFWVITEARQWQADSLSQAKSMAVEQPCQGDPDGLRFAPALTRLPPGQEISHLERKAEKCGL